MDTQTRQDGNFLVLSIDGEITLDNAQGLKEETRKLAETMAEPVFVLDLEKVSFIDSTGIGFLIVLKSRLEERDKKLVLLKPSMQAQRILELVQLNAFFTILPDETRLGEFA